jgi:ABC-type sugar transport system substrate-binding protein
MKRNFLLGMSALLLASMLSGCGGKGSESGTDTQIKIGIASRTMKEQIYRERLVGAEARAKELGVYMEWQACDLKPEREIEIVNNYITQGFNAIVLEAMDPETSVSIMVALAEAKLPVVVMDQEVMGGDGPYVMVTVDWHGIGTTSAEQFIQDFGTDKPANVVILGGTKLDKVAQDITRGYHDVLDKYPNVTIIQETYHEDWDRQRAMNTMQDVIARGDRIDGVLSNNDTMIMGAIRAAEEAGLKDSILFYGMDHDRDAVQEMKNGTKLKTKDLNAILGGQMLVDAAMAAAKGEAPTFDKVVNGVKMWYVPFRTSSYDNLEVSKITYPDMFE